MLPEILDIILLLVPLQDLLLHAPLVCKAWQQKIKASPRLQQALFLKPLPGKLLHLYETGWAEDEYDVHSYTVFANPWLHTIQTKVRPVVSFRVPAWDSDESLYEDKLNLEALNMEALERPEASWRRG
jgi:hypothetical protein